MLTTLGLAPLSLAQVTVFIGHGARVLVEKALGSGLITLSIKGLRCLWSIIRRIPWITLGSMLGWKNCYPAQAQGLKLTILTNKPETPSRVIVSGLGLTDFFTEIVGGDTLPTKKPDPLGVIYLQQQTGVALLRLADWRLTGGL
jgi:phosphoglycolate phosphatase